MSQLDNTLREAADKNQQLLSELSQTDYAPSSLKQNVSYISDLKSQIAATDKELSRLHQITEDEKKVRPFISMQDLLFLTSIVILRIM